MARRVFVHVVLPVAVLVAGVAGGPRAARADARADGSVNLEVQPVFAPALARYFVAVEVSVCAVRDFHGTVEVTDGLMGRTALSEPVDASAGTCERRQLPYLMDGSRLEAAARGADGSLAGRARWEGQVLHQPAVAVLDPSLQGFVRSQAVQVAVVVPTTASLPDDPLLWRGIGAVFTTATGLQALPAPVRVALDQWVELGGILVEVGEDGPPSSTRQGLGRRDLMRPDQGERLRDTLEQVYQRWTVAARPGTLESATFYLPMQPDSLDISGHRVPPVWLVAGLLLSAVLLLAVSTSAPVRRRLGSMAPVIGAPVIGLVVCLAIVGVGYAEKGGAAEYESLALVEVGSGSPAAAAQRVLGLLTTDAGETRVRGRPGALLLPLPELAGTPQSTTLVRGASDRMDVRVAAGLWQTLYLREDAILDLGGSVRLERGPGRRDIEIANETPFTIRGAVVIVDSGSEQIAIGDLAPGEQKVIPFARAFGRDPLPRAWRASNLHAQCSERRDVLVGTLDPVAIPDLPNTRAVRQTVLLRVEGR